MEDNHNSTEHPEVQVPAPSAPRRSWIFIGVAALAALGIAAFMLGRSASSEDVDAMRTGSTAYTTSDAPTTSATVAPETTVPPSPTSEPTAPTTATKATEPPPASAPATAVAATYAFPISPASSASPSSSHHDYPASDIFAPCGNAVVATTSGTIQEVTLVDKWSSRNDLPELRGGLSYSLVGDDGVRYYGSHLRSIDPTVQPGVHMTTGRQIGTVGETGNAAGTGCHLHFGISKPCGPGDVLRRRGQIWPQPYLRAWKSGEQRSPVAEIPSGSC